MNGSPAPLEHALEVVAARPAVLLGHDRVVPVEADQLAVLVAQQLAPVAVEQLDGLVDPQDEQDRPGDVEVVLRAGLGELALGDVDHHALGVQRAAGDVAHDRVALPHPLDGAVGRDQAVLAVELDLVLERAHLLHQHELAVVGVQALGPQLRLGDPALGGESEQRLDLRRDVRER